MSNDPRAHDIAVRMRKNAIDSDPLDRRFAWTEFTDRRAGSKIERKSSLRQIARTIQDTSAETKEELPLLKLATFGDKRTERGSLRSNDNMIAINGIELDFDAGDLTWDHAWLRLYMAGLAALLYTTPRYSDDCPRFRVLLPTSRALNPSERHKLVARAAKVLGGTVDPTSWTQSQAYYFGSAGDAQLIYQLVDPPGARSIDLASDLDATPSRHLKEATAYQQGALCDDDHEFGDLGDDPDVDKIRQSLDRIPAEERDTWLKVGMALHDEFAADEDGFELWDNWSRTTGAGNYEVSDQRSTWEAFGRDRIGRPVTIASLYRLAKIRSQDEAVGRLTFYRPSESAMFRSPEYVVKGLIARGDIACIFGPPGSGKSLVAPHLAYQVAVGEPFCGMRTKRGLVYYVAAEDESGMHQRIAAILAKQGDAEDFRLVAGVSDLFSSGSVDLASLVEAVERARPSLIVIDTLAIAFPGLEENDSTSMGRVIAACRQLAAHGGSVLVVHHGTKADGSTPRGHSSLNGALEMTMRVDRGEGGMVRIRMGKNKRGTTERELMFRIVTEELGTDEDGDMIVAPLLHELGESNICSRLRPTAAEAAALKELRQLESEGPVLEAAWRRKCIDERQVSDSEKEESRKKAMRRVVKGLEKKGLIEFRDEFVASASEVTSEDL